MSKDVEVWNGVFQGDHLWIWREARIGEYPFNCKSPSHNPNNVVIIEAAELLDRERILDE